MCNKVTANESANTASLYVDGVLAGTTGMYTNPTTTTNLTGFQFASNGTATSGELIYFDDIDFYDTTVGPTQYDTVKADKILTSEITDKTATTKSFGVHVSPNPAKGEVQINLTNAESGLIDISISNTSGVVIKKISYNAEKGNFSIGTSVQGYSPGVYITTAKQNSQVTQSKIDVY